jgi:hypothetical protein
MALLADLESYKFISEIDASDVEITNVLISVKKATRILHNKLTPLDQNQFVRGLNGC